MKSFSIGEAITHAGQLVRENIFIVLRLTLVGLGLSIISNYLSHTEEQIVFPTRLVLVFSALAVSILSIIVHIGFIKMGLEIIEGGKPKARDILSYQRYFWGFLGGNILYAAVIILSFLISLTIILLFAFIFHSIIIVALAIVAAFVAVVPAMYFFFTLPLIVDQNLGPIEAMKKSAEMTAGIRIDLFAFVVVAVLLNILGAVCMLIGLVISLPVTFLAYLLIYRSVLHAPTHALS